MSGRRDRDIFTPPSWFLVVLGIFCGAFLASFVIALARDQLDVNLFIGGAMTAIVSLVSGILVLLSRNNNGGPK